MQPTPLHQIDLTHVAIIAMIVGGLLAALLAGWKGRNVIGWCLFGCLAPLIAVGALIFMPALESELSDPNLEA